MSRWIHRFPGSGSLIPSAESVGGKGMGLAEMTALGLPVPPGFIMTTDVCSVYYDEGRNLPTEVEFVLREEIEWLERETGRSLGKADNPLLVSVRSGSPTSMPGMLDTVLNLGMNESVASGLADTPAGSAFAWDAYCRFIQMFGEVVLALDPEPFQRARKSWGVAAPEVAIAMRQVFEEQAGQDFPEDPWRQLIAAAGAVLDSWQSRRAALYRSIHGVPDRPGTAVTVQMMVFGNAGPDSATGVAFTRDPITGVKEPYGEYIPNAQGDEIVSGVQTPLPIRSSGAGNSLQETMPEVFGQLLSAFETLEGHKGAMQDIEFTVERGKLWLLQTRSGATSTEASLRIAADMVAEGLLDRHQAVRRLDPGLLGRLLHPSVRADLPREILTRGLPASPGAAAGRVALTSAEAEELAAQGEPVVLVLPETHPRDVHGVHAASAVLTARGGATSHAALVARGAGRPCVVGAGDVDVDLEAGCFRVVGISVQRGSYITVDGSSGEVSLGNLELERPQLGGSFATVLGWADDIRQLRVRANTTSPNDVDAARTMGAEAIGLFRTEFSFLEREALSIMRQILFADDAEQRRNAVSALLPLQRRTYADLFMRARGLPVTIRLLDLPLSEFLPKSAAEMSAAAKSARIRTRDAKAKAAALSDTNSTLGHRGCRLAISQPDLYAVQVRAILAEAEVAGVKPQILVPMIASAREFEVVRDAVAGTAAKLAEETGSPPHYSLGAMIELPRAVMQAGRIAETAEFFSFGTNNLTQTVFGVGRDDAAAFLERYRNAGLFAGDPYETLDTDGVGALLRLAVERGKAVRKDLEIGVCGEHGGDPDSIRFLNDIGLDYISCSPYRIPAARLAAAQAAMELG
ncbi:MAG: pyruvate, phosphate dikinase [Dehalococcoidia bacterium]|nr:pyruvate, phosphate dikinase [Dehalococcoidia bacterium]